MIIDIDDIEIGKIIKLSDYELDFKHKEDNSNNVKRYHNHAVLVDKSLNNRILLIDIALAYKELFNRNDLLLIYGYSKKDNVYKICMIDTLNIFSKNSLTMFPINDESNAKKLLDNQINTFYRKEKDYQIKVLTEEELPKYFDSQKISILEKKYLKKISKKTKIFYTKESLVKRVVLTVFILLAPCLLSINNFENNRSDLIENLKYQRDDYKIGLENKKEKISELKMDRFFKFNNISNKKEVILK